MSYDLSAFHPSLARNLEDVLELLESEGYVEASKPSVEMDADKWQIIRSLTDKHSHLEPFEIDYSRLAELQGTTLEQAQASHRCVEVNGPEDGPGIQLMIYDKSVDLTVPYWHKDQQARDVFSEIWDYLRKIADHGLTTIYDPQLDRLLDLEQDFEVVVGGYTGVLTRVDAVLEDNSKAEKPWWKFW